MLQNLARYVFESGRWFEPYHWIPAHGPICLDTDTAIVGLAFLADPTLEAVDTPHGRVEFIQGFGVTSTELDRLKHAGIGRSAEALVGYHRSSNPLRVTDLLRRDG